MSDHTNEQVSASSSEYPEQYIFKYWDDINDNHTSYDSEDFLNENLLRGIQAFGFEEPSEIQRHTILPMMYGKDVVGQAPSGTGKTGAFCIGTLGSIDFEKNKTQAIILSPTRELAIQTYEVCKSLSHFTKTTVSLFIGGTNVQTDKDTLMSSTKPQVIVGTPGRVYDMINRGWLYVDNVKMLVLDEADELLSRGFKEQIYNIVKQFNNSTRMALFSATMPQEVRDLSDTFMKDSIKKLVEPNKVSLDGIKQYYISVENDNQKLEALFELYRGLNIKQLIIYCNSVERVIILSDEMKDAGYEVDTIHSNMSIGERKEVISKFKSGASRVLVSTDLTARGIDVQQVNLVINFDITNDIHKYIHRIGRSGRWGRKGTAINLLTKRDVFTKDELETHYSINIEEWDMVKSEKLFNSM
jgi:translation initiation factor 4A